MAESSVAEPASTEEEVTLLEGSTIGEGLPYVLVDIEVIYRTSAQKTKSKQLGVLDSEEF